MLLSLKTGALVGQRALGEDPLAVTLAPGGRMAYVADNDAGEVIAVRLPSLDVAWRTQAGKTLSSLLYQDGRLYAGVYCCGEVRILDPATGRITGSLTIAGRPGELAWWQGGIQAGNGDDFGIAAAGGGLWTADRPAHAVAGAGRRVTLPAAPFWLAADGPDHLLVAAEGTPEDTAPGAVARVDTSLGTASVLASPRDPDQVSSLADDVFVAAHGDRDVLVLRGGRQLRWAPGAEAVALAPDAALGLLVVVTDAGE